MLGRADREVKITGERIDLSDVEAALRQAANGCDVAVVTGGNLHAHKKCNCHSPKQLVGFVADENADVEAIRATMLEVPSLCMLVLCTHRRVKPLAHVSRPRGGIDLRALSQVDFLLLCSQSCWDCR